MPIVALTALLSCLSGSSVREGVGVHTAGMGSRGTVDRRRAAWRRRIWYGTLEDHLHIYRPSATNYLVRGVGTFVIIALMFPGSRYLGAVLMGVGYVVAEYLSYRVALRIQRKRLRRRYRR